MRKYFFNYEKECPVPDLIGLQKNSYASFLQIDEAKRSSTTGISDVFRSLFPLESSNGNATLEFVSYTLEKPRYDAEECLRAGKTFSSALKAQLRLIVWSHPDGVDGSNHGKIDKNNKISHDAREIKAIKEQEVYLCDMPLMTEDGSFIINGAERVVVSQVHRAPGVFFDRDGAKLANSSKLLYTAKIIPYYGSWLDFEFDTKDLLYFRIDKKKKVNFSVLLKAMGMDNEQILNKFYNKVAIDFVKNNWQIKLDNDHFEGAKLDFDLLDAKTNELLLASGTKVNKRTLDKLNATEVRAAIIPNEILSEYALASNIINKTTGELLFSAGQLLTSEVLETLASAKIKNLDVIAPQNSSVGPYIHHSLMMDRHQDRKEALYTIYRIVRLGEMPPSMEIVERFFNSLFFDSERYDLSEVGRMKVSHRLKRNDNSKIMVLDHIDIIETLKILNEMKHSSADTDDIDNLENRRVRSVGELIQNQFKLGMLRIEKSIMEKISSVDIDSVMPQNLINAKPLMTAIKDFFATSQLSQFMEQTNPLAELAHKRRLSSLGPGGLTRDRAGFEVRDVHATHYGRICPIETPEGPNIGLINSLAVYAQVDQYGLLETPYYKVTNGVIDFSKEIFLSAIQESGNAIAQAMVLHDASGKITDDLVSCRKDGEFVMLSSDRIDYVDVSSKQLVSVATTLIPFLENDDANRALMGSNMQRQAVPLLIPEAPLVGTGMEQVTALDSKAALVAKRGGVVKRVDASRIVIEAEGVDLDDAAPFKSKKSSMLTLKDSRILTTTALSELIPGSKESGETGVDIYNLLKYQRSNQDTCINQKPLVKAGDVIEAGQIIADGHSTDRGELALGKNALVAFMPWNGYNFEDSILISERLVRDEVFTSIHIEEFEAVARDTRLGAEEITRDIPNVTEESLLHLDEVGIVHVGAEVKAGDILVGKTTPKSESPSTPEEKLLKVIFGEKAAEVRDSSLYLPPGVSGTVVDVRTFCRRGVDKDERSTYIELQQIKAYTLDRDDRIGVIESHFRDRLKELVVGEVLAIDLGKLKKGNVITAATFNDSITKKGLTKILIENTKKTERISKLTNLFESEKAEIERIFADKVNKLRTGDELMQGVLKIVKVFVAVKNRLQPGDKMAGRHGNKGVISKIVPAEDMPYLEDGTPVDIVLSPLGVPSRMNIGQVLEVHLGWASVNLGKRIGEILAKKSNQMLSELRSKLLEIYDRTSEQEKIKQLSDDDLLELAGRLTRGVPFATGLFGGISEDDITRLLKVAGVDESGQSWLIDGRTGERFDRKVTVGYMYILKLHHLVNNKIHARSIGPYSLITQQPLGGKSHFGGQRFGEMECWALQAYGAAYNLQEMLTVKSDDVVGRIKMYESIVQGSNSLPASIPESFNVMIKEMRSLCLDVDLIGSENNN